MQNKIIRSKNLYVCGSNTLVNTSNNISLSINDEVITLLDNYALPNYPDTFKNDYENYDETIDMLCNSACLVNVSDFTYDSRLLSEWANRYGKSVVEFSLDEYHPKIIYAARPEEPVHDLRCEILKVLSGLEEDCGAFLFPIHVCFLDSMEFSIFAEENGLSNTTYGFVDNRSVMVLNYELFFDPRNDTIFFPTLRHEGYHLWLAQNSVYLPFWIEEGLCELISMRSETKYINAYIANRTFLSFDEMNNKSENYVTQCDYISSLGTDFYNQAQSITDFIIETVGTELFYDLTKKTSIRRTFAETIYSTSGINLNQIEIMWKENILNII